MTSRFRRKLGERRYKRMFIIVAEGTVTEQEYFSLLNEESIVRVKCLSNSRNLSPLAAMKRVCDYVKREGLRRSDQAWVVVDKDLWLEEHLSQLHAWSQTQVNYGFALSNPKFEFWLLLHFEDGKGVASGDDCDRRIVKHLPRYDKHIHPNEFTPERIRSATERARTRDTPRCSDWPRNAGTTVYKLVEKILQASAQHPGL